MSPLLSVSSSYVLLLVVLGEDGGARISPQVVHSACSVRMPGSQRQWGCHGAVRSKGEEECSQWYCDKFGDRWWVESVGWSHCKNVSSLYCTPETDITNPRLYTNYTYIKKQTKNFLVHALFETRVWITSHWVSKAKQLLQLFRFILEESSQE